MRLWHSRQVTQEAGVLSSTTDMDWTEMAARGSKRATTRGSFIILSIVLVGGVLVTMG